MVLVLVLVSPRGDKLIYVLQIHFDSSNNEVEYEALLYGLCRGFVTADVLVKGLSRGAITTG